MIDPDGYRPNIGIVLMHPDGRLFWARRVHRDGWQFPQGGMNTDETPIEAMYRELREETGLLPDHVEVLGATDAVDLIRFPPFRFPLLIIPSIQNPLRILQIYLLQHFIRQVNPIDHPEPLQVVAGRAIEVFVVGFQEAVIDAERLPPRRGVGAEHDPVLVLQKKLAGRVRLAAELGDAGVEVNVIRGWLGHVSLDTTNRYAEITTRMKEAALRLCEPVVEDTASLRRTPVWRDDQALLQWLASL